VNMLGALVLIPSLGYFMLSSKVKSTLDSADNTVSPSLTKEVQRKGSELCNVMLP